MRRVFLWAFTWVRETESLKIWESAGSPEISAFQVLGLRCPGVGAGGSLGWGTCLRLITDKQPAGAGSLHVAATDQTVSTLPRAFLGVLLFFLLALNAVANYCVRIGCEAVIWVNDAACRLATGSTLPSI